MHPAAIDPAHWLPPVLFLPIASDLVAVRRDKVIWEDLVDARDGYRKGKERARQRWWRKSYGQYSAKLARIEAVIEVFAPLMAGDPTLGFEPRFKG